MNRLTRSKCVKDDKGLTIYLILPNSEGLIERFG